MNNLSSVIGFFYNIVPGFLFLFINDYHFHIIFLQGSTNLTDLSGNSIGILVLLTLSLFLGFIFQSLTKLTREFFLNKMIFDYIRNKDEGIYNSAVSKLKSIKSSKTLDVVENFYLMHNFISSNKKDLLPEYFSARFAFWSNIFFCLLLSLISFSLSKQERLFNLDRVTIFFLFQLALVYSTVISLMNFKNLYDSVLKTFITQLTIKSSNP